MNLNKIKLIEPKTQCETFAKKYNFTASPIRQQYSNTINLSSQMTQPEDQKNYGTCVAWSSTTFIESLLWKLTGEKEEFTPDEVYNLYLDTYGYDPITDAYIPVDAEKRKIFYGNGDWANIPEEIGDAGLAHWIANMHIFNDNVMDQIYVYYWIIHYNDPDVRKHHYPDKYSKLCDKAKNYIYKNLYSFHRDETAKITGYSILNPLNIKKQLVKFGMPVLASLDGTNGGHAVVCTVDENNTFKFNSSWDASNIFYINMQYNVNADINAGESYYTKTSYPLLNTVNGIDYYMFPCNGLKLNILSSDGGYIHGAEDQDRFNPNIDITLNAIPNDGQYFNRWVFYNGTSQDFNFLNPCTFNITTDLSVKAEFSDQPLSAKYILNISQPEHGQVLGASDGQLFQYGEEVILSVQCGVNEFISWNDGNIDNPRRFTMTENRYAYPIVKVIYDPSTTVIRMFDSNVLSIAHAEAPSGKEISVDFGE